jgi:membrane protein required for colicin V production
MNVLDFTVIAVLAASIGLGWFRGFVYELLSMFGWPIALLLSKRYAADVALQLPIHPEILLIAVTYAIIFVVTLLVWGLIIIGFFKLVKAVGLGKVDKALGVCFGIIRGFLVLLVLVWLSGLTTLPDQPLWSESAFTSVAEDLALQNKQYLPDDVAQRIHYKNRR